MSSKNRERETVKEYRAVFIIGIGEKLINGVSHDNRAADYDDWSLNGDLLVYNEVLDNVLELSSMGIRVDDVRLKFQLKERKQEFKEKYEYHKNIK